MINIHMLVWGAKHVGPAQDLRMDADPATTWMQMAIAHARQVTKNHIRPDGSTYHIVEYNPFEGTVNRRYTYQVGEQLKPKCICQGAASLGS
jgi:unsaturated chondroitin disaccharide hydrolase